MKYAQNTSVSVEKSRAEIESTLAKYGASQFGYAVDNENGIASIQFRAKNRDIRFVLNLPKIGDFRRTATRGYIRTASDQNKLWEQACRQRWRALALCIKAKLEAVDCGITDFEREFLAHIILPSGQSVAHVLLPQIAHAYESGDDPPGIAGFLTSKG